MNKTLLALMTQLTSQINTVKVRIQEENIVKNQLVLQMEEDKKAIEDANITPYHINPEQEMARLSFVLKKHDMHAKTTIQLKEQEICITHLENKLIRLKTEVHLLEKYQTREDEKKMKEILTKESNAQDAWALTKGHMLHENNAQ